MWVTIDKDVFQVGSVGFLKLQEWQGTDMKEYRLNQFMARGHSHEVKLFGFCGNTGGYKLKALGIGKITQISQGGRRARIRQLKGSELHAALEDLDCFTSAHIQELVGAK